MYYVEKEKTESKKEECDDNKASNLVIFILNYNKDYHIGLNNDDLRTYRPHGLFNTTTQKQFA
jgi:hypothetical protein